jgi:hypothetical protein
MLKLWYKNYCNFHVHSLHTGLLAYRSVLTHSLAVYVCLSVHNNLRIELVAVAVTLYSAVITLILRYFVVLLRTSRRIQLGHDHFQITAIYCGI